MHAFLARRSLFVASVLAIGAIAATAPAAADDAGTDDAGDASMEDASTTMDSMAPVQDATVGTADAAPTPDAGPVDEGDGSFDLYASDAGPPQDDGSLPTYSGPNIFQSLCVEDPAIADPTAAPFAFTTVQAPYTTPAQCMNYADEGHPAIHNCYCQNCFNLIQQCDALPGCKEILQCAFANPKACQTASNCYFTACSTVIDKWANTSLASFLTSELETCATTNNCPMQ
jgi:hypothetical protein